MNLGAAIILGLLGSFHCVGMCGAIVLALPSGVSSFFHKLVYGFLYNIGRVITYGFMGLLLGVFGEGLNLANLQQVASVVIGAIMIVSVFLPSVFTGLKKIVIAPQFNYINKLKQSMGRLLAQQSLSSMLFIGILNGFLPCGLVYIAIASAVAIGDLWNGFLFMTAFGLATVPILLGLYLSKSMISIQLKRIVNKIIPIFIVILGLLFILRGLNLGIPYLSPTDSGLQVGSTQSSCH